MFPCPAVLTARKETKMTDNVTEIVVMANRVYQSNLLEEFKDILFNSGRIYPHLSKMKNSYLGHLRIT